MRWLATERIAHQVRGGPNPHLDQRVGMLDSHPHLMAYYYNANISRNVGRLDAVFNIKNVPKAVLSTVVRDFEMSQADVVESNPWQTDACIGGWRFSR